MRLDMPSINEADVFKGADPEDLKKRGVLPFEQMRAVEEIVNEFHYNINDMYERYETDLGTVNAKDLKDLVFLLRTAVDLLEEVGVKV